MAVRPWVIGPEAEATATDAPCAPRTTLAAAAADADCVPLARALAFGDDADDGDDGAEVDEVDEVEERESTEEVADEADEVDEREDTEEAVDSDDTDAEEEEDVDEERRLVLRSPARFIACGCFMAVGLTLAFARGTSDSRDSCCGRKLDLPAEARPAAPASESAVPSYLCLRGCRWLSPCAAGASKSDSAANVEGTSSSKAVARSWRFALVAFRISKTAHPTIVAFRRRSILRRKIAPLHEAKRDLE